MTFDQARLEIAISAECDSELPASAKLSEIGIDSLDFLLIVQRLEQFTSIPFPETKLFEMQTVGDMAQWAADHS